MPAYPADFTFIILHLMQVEPATWQSWKAHPF